MIQYLEIMQEILQQGTKKPPARERMPATISRFSIQKRFDLADGFPLVTTRKIFIKGMIHELIWFLKGDTSIHYLHINGVKKFWHEDVYKFYVNKLSKEDTHVRSWDEWNEALNDKEYADKFGNAGLIYPHQWRNWQGELDQIGTVIENIKKNPASRYHVITAWNPSETGNNIAALPPCHMLFMFNCRPMTTTERFEWANEHKHLDTNYIYDYRRNHTNEECEKYLDSLNAPKHFLDLDLTQRSVDTPLGLPVNIASYALLLHIFAKLTNMVAGEFIWCGKDVHLYDNQLETANIQLSRKPRPLPKLIIKGEWESINDVKHDDFEIIDYNPHPKLDYVLSTGVIKK